MLRLLFGTVLCLAAMSVPLAHDPFSTRVTWEREISGIVERRCLGCHRAGGFAPFSLERYDEARPWAVAIKEETLAGHMPPWGAAPGVGHFVNERRLTRHEMELVAAWVDGGAPRSLPEALLAASMPAPRDPDRQASSAPPDAPPGGTIVPLVNAVITEATRRDTSVTLRLPDGYWLTAWSFEPGSPALIERVDLEVGPRWIGTWTAGDPPLVFPDGSGVSLPATSSFTARIAYRAPAERTIDRSRLRVWLSQEPRLRAVRDTTVLRSWRAPADVVVFALKPARDDGQVEAVARFGDGRTLPLGAFEPPWRAPHPTYQLDQPVALPAGTRVETTGPVRLLYLEESSRSAARPAP